MNRKRFAIDLAVGFGIFLAVCWYRGLFRADSFEKAVSALSDGAFLAAVLTGGVGCLMAIRNQGTFDGMAFTMRQTLSLHWPGTFGEYRRDFQEYRDKKKEKRTSSKEILVAGGVYLALTAVFTIIYLCL